MFGTGTVTVTVNGQATDVTITSGQNSLAGIAAAVNAAGAGVYAAVVQVDGGWRLLPAYPDRTLCALHPYSPEGEVALGVHLQ
ncbi:MAG: flagellin hook IN motif-containing protein, partial [Armatimonadota bacterium]|nr:flagellin hook IN motif-containing protein [Armatimonadota bacterium]